MTFTESFEVKFKSFFSQKVDSKIENCNMRGRAVHDQEMPL